MAREIVRFESVDSTMHEAAQRAAAGCASGTVVVAEEQTAGVGRFGRTWHSERSAGLYFSIVLRPQLAGAQLPVITLALGLAAADAVTGVSGVACDLRWPNDLLVHGKKVAGILVQLQDGAVVAGIGLNVNHQAFPEEIAVLATSLRIASGREHSREALLEQLLPAIDRYVELLEQAGPEPILKLFTEASSYVRGRRVVVDQEGDTLRGTTDGLTETGFLRLREDNGKRTVVLAGGVRPE